MARKTNRGLYTVPKGVTVRWVRKANLWCKTYALNGKQVQEWSSEKPNKDLPKAEA